MPRRDPFKGCDDFRRTRRPVELTRRQIVLGGLSIYAATALGPSRLLQAARAQSAAAPDAPVLVSVFLPGGCDLLSTLTPLDQTGRLADLRRSITTEAPTPLATESRIGLHPSLAGGLNGGVRGRQQAAGAERGGGVDRQGAEDDLAARELDGAAGAAEVVAALERIAPHQRDPRVAAARRQVVRRAVGISAGGRRGRRG